MKWRNARYSIARTFLIILLTAGLTSCGGDAASDGADETAQAGPTASDLAGEVFGNGFKDLTPVVARVGDLEITEQDMELRLNEMPNQLRQRFTGEMGPRTLVRFMVDEALMMQLAHENKMYLDPLVAQQLVAYQRKTMVDAYKQFEVYEGVEPTEDEIRAHYEQFSQSYTVAGAANGRHIECLTEAEADAAYAALQGSGENAVFTRVLTEYSKNIETAKIAGSLGWFNKGGFIAHVKEGVTLSRLIFDWEIGLHPPIQVGDRWHVIEILSKRPARQKALAEVSDQIVREITPTLQSGVLDAHLAEQRKDADIEYFGIFAPGEGRDALTLIKSAMATKDFDAKVDILEMILEDYPTSEQGAQALFLKANAFIDRYGDTRTAKRSLRKLLEDYPDSPLRDQAEYMLANLDNTNFRTPTSIDELRGGD